MPRKSQAKPDRMTSRHRDATRRDATRRDASWHISHDFTQQGSLTDSYAKVDQQATQVRRGELTGTYLRVRVIELILHA